MTKDTTIRLGIPKNAALMSIEKAGPKRLLYILNTRTRKRQGMPKIPALKSVEAMTPI